MMSQNDQIYLAVIAARLSKCAGSLWDIMHERAQNFLTHIKYFFKMNASFSQKIVIHN